MPFTGSHPAAVLPLLGLPALPVLGVPLVPAALVAGSMAPDLPLFVPLPFSTPTAAAHAPVGIVGLDVALAAGMLAVWRGLMRPVLVAAAPAGVRARLGPPFTLPTLSPAGGPGPASGAAALAVSAAVGAATHLGWDMFTHDGRLGVRRIGWLQTMHGPLPGYEWAQYASGVVGAAVLGCWTLRWYRRTPPVEPGPAPETGPRAQAGQRAQAGEPVMPRTAAAGGAAVVVLAAAASGLFAARPWLQRREWAMAGFFGATRGGRGAVLAVVAGGLCWRAWNHLTADIEKRDTRE